MDVEDIGYTIALAPPIQPETGIAPVPISNEPDLTLHTAQDVEYDADAGTIALFVSRHNLENGCPDVIWAGVHGDFRFE